MSLSAPPPLFSPTASLSSASLSPTSSGSPISYGPTLSTSSSMYLYTFLATLLLLLGVSSAIVLRSIVLRRRQRRMIETAIADGTWIQPRARQRRSGRSKNLGAKPKMFVAALGKEEPECEGEGAGKERMREEEKLEKFKWADILPVSASYVTPSTDNIPTIPPAPRSTPRGSRPTSSILRISPAPTPRSISATNTPPPEPNSRPDDPKQLRISVIIAMPTRHPIRTDQEDLPPMEIGVAELSVDGKTIDYEGDMEGDDRSDEK